MAESLKVNSIFLSIQGESTYAGLPCGFIRLTGCNLRCVYCDTKYAYKDGRDIGFDEILERLSTFGVNMVEITGGEPLKQKATPALARKLLDKGYKVLVETNGSCDTSTLPDECIRILDIKTPASGCDMAMFEPNKEQLRSCDEVKFVVCSRDDFDWAVEQIEKYKLADICPVNISPAEGMVDAEVVAKWILASNLPLRLNLQLHKLLNME